MAAMAVAVLSWPTVCFGEERLDSVTYDRFEPIGKQEWLSVRQDMYLYNLIPEEIDTNCELFKEFCSKVFEIDDIAKDIYSSQKEDEIDEYFTNLFRISYNDTFIYVLEFISFVDDFCYLATKAADGKLCISDVKIDSAPVVISKDGYIAGFEENIDEYYVKPTIYTFSLDKATGNISLTKIGTFFNRSEDWKLYPLEVWDTYLTACPNPAFWHEDTLYMEGLMLDMSPGHEGEVVYPCFYKLNTSGLK